VLSTPSPAPFGHRRRYGPGCHRYPSVAAVAAGVVATDAPLEAGAAAFVVGESLSLARKRALCAPVVSGG
jgi:hypothetical protein